MSLVKMTFLGCIVGFWFSCHVHTPGENTITIYRNCFFFGAFMVGFNRSLIFYTNITYACMSITNIR